MNNKRLQRRNAAAGEKTRAEGTRAERTRPPTQPDIRTVNVNTGAWQRQHDGAVSVALEGASASADPQTNHKAIQKTFDDVYGNGGGQIYIPPVDTARGERYRTSEPLVLRPHTEVFGAGDDSYIANTHPANPQLRQVFNFGSYQPLNFNWLDWRPILPVQAGTQSITFRNASSLAGVSVGSILYLQSADGYTHTNPRTGASPFKPRVARLNRVTGISGTTVTLHYPIKDSFDEGSACPADVIAEGKATTDARGRPVYTLHNTILRDLSVSSDHSWMAQTSLFECTIRNITVRKSINLVFGNGFSHCLVDNIRGTFSNKAVEAATFSHDSIFRNIYATYLENPDNDEKVAIKLGEYVTDCVFEDIHIEGVGFAGASAINIMDAARNRLTNVHANVPNVRGAAVEFRSGSGDYNVENTVENCEFHVQAAQRHLHFQDASSQTRNIVRDSQFRGTVARQSILLAGEDNLIEGCVFETGLVAASANSGHNTVRNNRLLGFSKNPNLEKNTLSANITSES